MINKCNLNSVFSYTNMTSNNCTMIIIIVTGAEFILFVKPSLKPISANKHNYLTDSITLTL